MYCLFILSVPMIDYDPDQDKAVSELIKLICFALKKVRMKSEPKVMTGNCQN